MGYYIETLMNAGKADQIIATHGAARLPDAPKWADIPDDKAVVCIVDNGPFEAAGLCYSESELKEFSDPNDTRPHTWLVMDKVTAYKLAGFSP